MNAHAGQRLLSVMAVEDEALGGEGIRTAAAAEGVEIAWVESGSFRDALALAEVTRFDAVLLDAGSTGSPGDTSGSALSVLRRLRDHYPDLAVVVVTDDLTGDAGPELVAAGADEALDRAAVGSGALTRAVRYAVERHRLEAEIAALGLTDPLTGLRNRRGFLTVAQQVLRVATRYRLTVAAITLGLEQSTKSALREFASVLRRCARSSDVVARTGELEFTVLMLDPGPGGVDKVLRRISVQAGRRQTGSEPPQPLEWTVGVAHQSWGTGELLENLLDRSARGMYRRMVAARERRAASS